MVAGESQAWVSSTWQRWNLGWRNSRCKSVVSSKQSSSVQRQFRSCSAGGPLCHVWVIHSNSASEEHSRTEGQCQGWIYGDRVMWSTNEDLLPSSSVGRKKKREQNMLISTFELWKDNFSGRSDGFPLFLWFFHLAMHLLKSRLSEKPKSHPPLLPHTSLPVQSDSRQLHNPICIDKMIWCFFNTLTFWRWFKTVMWTKCSNSVVISQSSFDTSSPSPYLGSWILDDLTRLVYKPWFSPNHLHMVVSCFPGLSSHLHVQSPNHTWS